MNHLYFWIDGEVVIEHWGSPTYKRIGYLVVDAMETTAMYRYGMYNERGAWSSIPKQDFPPAFLLELLLLGVT